MLNENKNSVFVRFCCTIPHYICLICTSIHWALCEFFSSSVTGAAKVVYSELRDAQFGTYVNQNKANIEVEIEDEVSSWLTPSVFLFTNLNFI